MKEGKTKLMGQLLNQSHEGLRTKYEVSCDELDLLVDLSQNEPSVYGARMMGGGFGGCALILMKNDSKMNVSRRIARSYEEIAKIKPAIYHLNIVDGVKRLI
jgi:galactokinase